VAPTAAEVAWQVEVVIVCVFLVDESFAIANEGAGVSECLCCAIAPEGAFWEEFKLVVVVVACDGAGSADASGQGTGSAEVDWLSNVA
jgi:hypothetical protein